MGFPSGGAEHRVRHTRLGDRRRASHPGLVATGAAPGIGQPGIVQAEVLPMRRLSAGQGLRSTR
ncbi:hypothetical protein D8B34_01225 [Verminephrobacter eiseniae]|nr:hypothetical protein [Verminephrobacter eiseniae]MCW5260826.1 hypothetical protein [Verminephrobacter eiseniae]MCW5295714.1 hypothetical protein [Verminephrobacter eiseniae]MCW8184625.1 hypothetical protein [Verminephrobacter eiseniae]MCW8223301.1 hypothetical protein [Verminephrobacter eiseniae]